VAISTSGARHGTLTFGKLVLLEGGVLRREKVFAGAIPREHQ